MLWTKKFEEQCNVSQTACLTTMIDKVLGIEGC